MSESSVKTIIRSLNALEAYKPHPKWFVPFGTKPRNMMYNGALFQMILLAPIVGGFGYLLGRKGSLQPAEGSPGEKVTKSLQASVRLPRNIEAGTDTLATELKKKKLLDDTTPKEANDNEYPQFMDYYMMGALPTLAAFVYGTLGFAKGTKNRKAAEKGKALLNYYKANKEYDRVLAEKLYPKAPATTPTYVNPPDTDSPDIKEASVKEAGLNWTFTENDKDSSGFMGMVTKKALQAPWSLTGSEPMLGMATLASLISSFYLGKKIAESRSPERKRLKQINKALETRQTHRYIPKLVLPKSVGVPQK